MKIQRNVSHIYSSPLFINDKNYCISEYFNYCDRYWFNILEHLVLPFAMWDEKVFLQFHRESNRCEMDW
jgi:hypothetical protein